MLSFFVDLPRFCVLESCLDSSMGINEPREFLSNFDTMSCVQLAFVYRARMFICSNLHL